MPRLKRLMLVFAGALAIQHLPAQTPVTMKDAVQYALSNSEVLKKAKLDIEKGFQQIKETKGAALPQVNVTSVVNNNPLVMVFPMPAEFMGGEPGKFIAMKAGQPWTGNAQVQLLQQLYNKQVFTGLKAARTTEEFYRLSEQLSRENVIHQVAANYYQVQISRLQMDVIEANIERVAKLEEMILAQYQNGLVKKIDVDRVKVNRSNLDAQKLMLENGLKQMENMLKYYMGMPVEEQIVLADIDLPSLQIPSSNLIDNEPLNVSNLLSFSVLKKQEELLGFQREAIRAESFPTVSLSGNYSYNSQAKQLSLYTSKALNYDMASISLNIRIPIFDGFSRKSRVAQSDIEIRRLQEDMRNTQNGLNMANDNAKTQLSNSLRTIQMQRANKDLAQEVFENVQNNYTNGLANLTDLLNAETSLFESQRSLNEALLQYKIGEIELLKSNGNINSLLD